MKRFLFGRVCDVLGGFECVGQSSSMPPYAAGQRRWELRKDGFCEGLWYTGQALSVGRRNRADPCTYQGCRQLCISLH
jgi:hypothetical protein